MAPGQGAALAKSSTSRRTRLGESIASPATTSTDGADQLCPWGVLEEEPAGAGFHRLVQVLVQVKGCEHEHSYTGGPVSQQGLGGSEPVDPGHPHIEQGDVRGTRRTTAMIPSPSAASPTTSMSGSVSRIGEAGTHECLVLRDDDPQSRDGSRRLPRIDDPGAGDCAGSSPAVQRHAFAHAHQTLSRVVTGWLGVSPSGVAYVDRQRLLAVSRLDAARSPVRA